MKRDETRDGLRQVRSIPTSFETREEAGEKHITGYFAVFNSNYEIGPGMSESIAPGTFLGSLNGDVRALTNHDSTLVLGRTTAGTLKIREDETGLWGDITINPRDTDAMNTWERVQRGDVNQCSFGFIILKESSEIREDGSVHWTIEDVDLHEVSVCTFPAYEATNVQARSAQRAEIREREFAAWKDHFMRRIHNGSESDSSAEEN